MSWLRRRGPAAKGRPNGVAPSEPTSLAADETNGLVIDSKAALDSFKNHWRQVNQIITWKCIAPNSYLLNGSSSANAAVNCDRIINHDDVTSIINHVDHMITLLIQESQGMTRDPNATTATESTPIMMSPLLDYLLMESILDKLMVWSSNCGEYCNVMKLEQLKLYELLVSQLCHQQALYQKPLLRPLFQLLAECSECSPVEVEKRLVILLNTLCVGLSTNPDLLELFFVPDDGNLGAQLNNYLSTSSPRIRTKFATNKPESQFLVFSLLIPFVHREGPIGQQARDSLLLIMSLSTRFENVGKYIGLRSNFCPVLATGLSGLYSSLPRRVSSSFATPTSDWYRITPKDIREKEELQMFLNSLEFCNAVVQVAHPHVKNQLLEYIYQGFLFSVIGPALHQETLYVPLDELEKSPKYLKTLEELIATTAYLELFLRTVTEPCLLRVFLKLIIAENFDGHRILYTLITRLRATSTLGLVTLVLFRTIIDLSCEDVMLELIFRYLQGHKYIDEPRDIYLEKVYDPSYLVESVKLFLSFYPTFVNSSHTITRSQSLYPNRSTTPNNSLPNFELDFNSLQASTASHSSQKDYPAILRDLIDSLCDAHHQVTNICQSTSEWTCNYDDIIISEEPINENAACDDSGIYLNNNHKDASSNKSANKQSEPVPHADTSPSSSPLSITNSSQSRNDIATDSAEECIDVGEFIGPFLTNILWLFENFLTNDLNVNLQLIEILSSLASYPQPLLKAYLLNNNLIFHPSVKSLPKILRTISEEIYTKARTVVEFERLLFNARLKYPLRETQAQYESSTTSISRRSSNASAEVTFNINPAPKEYKRKGFKELLFRGRSTSSPDPHKKTLVNRIDAVNSGFRYSMRSTSGIEQALEATRYMENKTNDKMALAVIVFEKFILQLTAISQEQWLSH